MANSATQTLQIILGGRVDPSVANAFRGVTSRIDALRGRITSLTRTYNLNTRSTRQNSDEQSRSMTMLRRLWEMRNRETDSVRRSTMEHSRLFRVLRSIRDLESEGGSGRGRRGDMSPLVKGSLGVASAGSAMTAYGIYASRGEAASLDGILTEAAIIQGKDKSVMPDLHKFFMNGSARGVTNQSEVALASIFRDALTSGQLNWDQAKVASLTSGKWATSQSADPTDVMKASISGISKFGVTPEQLDQYLAALAVAGKRGNFEFKDMANLFPSAASHASKLGLSGVTGAARMAAHLQAARMGAANSEIAGNDYYNLLEKLTSPESEKALAKDGINLQAIKRRVDIFNADPANKAKGEQKDVLSEMLAQLNQKNKGKNEMQIASSLSEFFGDMQARRALASMVVQQEFMKSVEADARGVGSDKNKSTELRDKDYAQRIEALDASWTSIGNSLERIKISFALSFKPWVSGVANMLDKVAGVTQEVAMWSPGLTASIGPIITIGGGIAAILFKLRTVGLLMQTFGRGGALSTWGTKLRNIPSLTSMIGRGFRGMWGLATRGLTGFMGKLNTLRFFGGAFMSRAGNAMARLGPFIMRGAGVLMRGVGAFFTGAVGSFLLALGASIAAAIGGWKIGQWLYNSTAIGPWLDSIAEKLTGFEARMRELSKPTRNLTEHFKRDRFNVGTQVGINSAHRRLRGLESFIAAGKDHKDYTVQQAKDYAAQLRQQLATAKATNVTLQGEASSSKHETTLNVNVTGADAPGAGQAVRSEMEAALQARDREINRNYRSSSATGFLGE